MGFKNLLHVSQETKAGNSNRKKKPRTAALVVEKMKNEERTDKHGSKELQKFSLTSLKQSLCVSIKSWSCCEF